jgi:hypothetical protein
VLNSIQDPVIKKKLLWLIVIATTVRLFLASQLELANDEVYYWTYALFPNLSHFDHPPMVGILAQLSTFNLWLTDDFFLRFDALVAWMLLEEWSYCPTSARQQ